MISVSQQRIRSAIDLTQWLTAPLDVIANASPSIANGADLRFELLLSYGSLAGDSNIASTSNWASLYVQLKPTADKDGLDLWQGAGTVSSSAFNPSITYANWEAGTDQQVVVTIPSSANSVLLTADTQQFWMVIYAETTDSPAKVIPVCSFPVTLYNAGLGVVPPSYVAPAGYYNKTQSDARYVQIGTDYSGFATIAGTTFTGAVVLASGQMSGATGLYATTKTYTDAGDAATLAACCQLTGAQTVAGAKAFSSLLTASAGLAVSGGSLSVAGLSGVLQATAGVVSGGATTDSMPEGALNAYFTQARVLTAQIAGYAAASGTVTAADTVLTALSKLGYAASIANTGQTVWAAANQAAMLALATAKTGDVAYRTDIAQAFVLQGTYTVLANWKQVPNAVTTTLTGGTVTLLANNTSGAYVAVTSNNVPEGVSNLYFTNARALAQASTLLAGSTFSGTLSFSGTTNQGLVVNSLTTTQIGALAPANGNIVYDTVAGALKACIGGSFVPIQTGSVSAISSVLTGFTVGGAMPVTSSDTILSALQKHEYLLEGNGNLKFVSSASPGLIVNNVAGISGLTVSSSTYGAIVYDTAANVLKAYTSSGWVPLSQGASYLPLTAGSGNPLTGALYFGTTMNQVMAGSNTQLNFCSSSTILFTLDNSASTLKSVNAWFDSTASTGYKVNGQSTLYTTSSRTVLDFGNSFTVTTASSGGPLVIGYSGSGISVDTSNDLQLPALLQMGSGADNKTIDQNHYYYDSGGHQILAAQQGAVVDATAVSGSPTADAGAVCYGFSSSAEMTTFIAGVNTAITQLNGLLAAVRTHGLIAT